MSKETRIGLVVGLLFIIMFGLVLAGILNPKSPPDNSPAPGGVAMATNAAAGGGEGDREYGYIPTTPAMDAEHHPAPAAPPVSARPVSEGAAATEPGAAAGSGSVEVAMARPESEPMAGEEHGISVPAARPAEGDSRITETGGGVHTGPIEVTLPPGVHTPEDARGARSVVGAAPGDEPMPAGTSIYEVKQGDSLYKIAAQLWGSKNASKNALILAANKDKIKSANNLKVGMKLVIPPLPGSPAAPAAAPTPTTGPSTPAPRSRHEHSPADVAGTGTIHTDGDTLPLHALTPEIPLAPVPVAAKIYTIKSGDTVLRVAKTYHTSVDKILELNKGVNPTKLKIGQKLTIPS